MRKLELNEYQEDYICRLLEQARLADMELEKTNLELGLVEDTERKSDEFLLSLAIGGYIEGQKHMRKISLEALKVLGREKSRTPEIKHKPLSSPKL